MQFTSAMLLASLALLLPRAHPDTAAADETVSDAAAYMKLYYAEPLKIAALAKMAHLSESRFRARFAEAYGMPPSRFRGG